MMILLSHSEQYTLCLSIHSCLDTWTVSWDSLQTILLLDRTVGFYKVLWVSMQYYKYECNITQFKNWFFFWLEIIYLCFINVILFSCWLDTKTTYYLLDLKTKMLPIFYQLFCQQMLYSFTCFITKVYFYVDCSIIYM